MRQFGIDFLIGSGFAYLMFAAFFALPIAIIITLVLIRRFRARVARSMRQAMLPAAPDLARAPPSGAAGELKLERIDATRTRAVAALRQPEITDARRRMRALTMVYAVAAMAYPVLLALVIMAAPPWVSGLVPAVLLFLTYVLENSMPVALAPTVVVNRQPRYLGLAALALVALVWIWSRSVVPSAIELTLMTAGVPTAAILLLNVRRFRAVGPVVFTATLVLVYGLTTGLAYATIYMADVIGPWHFVREDLAGLPLVDAVMGYLAWLASLSPDQAMAALSQLTSNPESVIIAENREALTGGLWLRFFAIWLAATAVGAVAAWIIVRWLARSYEARRASDQMLTIDVIMLILCLSLFVTLAMANWVYAAGVLVGLAGYKVVTRSALRRRRETAPAPAPRPLLLLRVFGFDRRTQQLLDDLGRRWRYLGPIRLIGGTDLAYATIEPHEFFEFLSGRLSRAFIKDEADLERRLSDDAVRPDPDGLFRIEDFFCHDDTWRITVSRLARDASAVLMDLRGFSPANQGCIFEIEELIAAVPVHRVVLLIDDSTDVPFLERTLAKTLQAMPADSPNVAAGEHRLQILEASANRRHTLATLLGLLCEHPRAPVATGVSG